MVSETVDPIDWPLLSPLMGSAPWVPSAQYKSVQSLPGINPESFSMRGNHPEYAATINW